MTIISDSRYYRMKCVTETVSHLQGEPRMSINCQEILLDEANKQFTKTAGIKQAKLINKIAF